MWVLQRSPAWAPDTGWGLWFSLTKDQGGETAVAAEEWVGLLEREEAIGVGDAEGIGLFVGGRRHCLRVAWWEEGEGVLLTEVSRRRFLVHTRDL